MPLLPTIGRTVGTGVKALRMLVRGSVRGSAWATRRVGDARARGAANEIGMVRLSPLIVPVDEIDKRAGVKWGGPRPTRADRRAMGS